MTMVKAYAQIPQDFTLEVFNKLRGIKEHPGLGDFSRPNGEIATLSTICDVKAIAKFNGEWGHLLGAGYDCLEIELHISEAEALAFWITANAAGGKVLLVI